MKIKILGSASGLPTSSRNHSCLLVSGSKANLLVDCGEPAARTLVEMGYDPDFLDGIVITHFHPDHVCGIYMVIQLLHIKKRKKDLYLYLPESISAFRASLDMFYLFPEKLPYKLMIRNISEVEQDFKFLSIMENDHLRMYRDHVTKNGLPNELKSYSISFTGDTGAVLYTSDLSNVRALSPAINSARIIIIDALHPSLEQIEEVIFTQKDIILTHGISQKLEDQLKTRIYNNVKKADDYQEIQF